MAYHAEFKRVNGNDWVLSIQKDDIEVAEHSVPEMEWSRISFSTVGDKIGFLISQCNKWLKINSVPGLFGTLRGDVTLPPGAKAVATALNIPEAEAEIYYQTTKFANAATFFDYVRTVTNVQLGVKAVATAPSPRA